MSDSAEANQEVTNVVTEALLGPVALFESHSTERSKREPRIDANGHEATDRNISRKDAKPQRKDQNPESPRKNAKCAKMKDQINMTPSS